MAGRAIALTIALLAIAGIAVAQEFEMSETYVQFAKNGKWHKLGERGMIPGPDGCSYSIDAGKAIVGMKEVEIIPTSEIAGRQQKKLPPIKPRTKVYEVAGCRPLK